MKLIVLDRDGVINHDSDAFIKNPSEWHPISGSLEAIAKLYHAGYKVVIATNQSGLGRQLFNIDHLNAIHKKLQDALRPFEARIDAFFICPHHPKEKCTCRKPNTGMFDTIKIRYGISPGKNISVGDSLRDLQAASSAGFIPYLVLTGKGQKTKEQGNLPPHTTVHDNLHSLVVALIGD